VIKTQFLPTTPDPRPQFLMKTDTETCGA
jgi:hypothetical protein